LFHTHAPATGKVRHPTVESLMAGTNRLSVVEVRSHVEMGCQWCLWSCELQKI